MKSSIEVIHEYTLIELRRLFEIPDQALFIHFEDRGLGGIGQKLVVRWTEKEKE